MFLLVAETRSMTAAAARFGLTQPAVSQLIGELETSLGVQLIDRKLRPLGLTAAGTMLQQNGRHLIESAWQITEAVRDSTPMKLPRIRIGLLDSIFATLAPALGSALRDETDHLSLWTGNTLDHTAAFLARKLDAVVINAAMEVEDVDRYELIEEPYVLLLPESRRDSDNSDLEQLARELPFIRYTARQSMEGQVERYFRRLKLEIPRGQEFDHTQAIISLVSGGLGWSMSTPLCVMESLESTPGIFFAPLPGPGIYRKLILIARAEDLGRMPERIAKIARHVLRDQCLPKLIERMPWISEKIRILK